MSYRPITRGETDEIQIWSNVLEVGGPLPVLPLALDKGQCVPLDLEVTYETACHRMRLPPD